MVGNIVVAIDGWLAEVFASTGDKIATARVISAVGDQVVNPEKRRTKNAGTPNISTQMYGGDFANETMESAETEGAGTIVLGRRSLASARVREAVEVVAQKFEDDRCIGVPCITRALATPAPRIAEHSAVGGDVVFAEIRNGSGAWPFEAGRNICTEEKDKPATKSVSEYV